LALVFAPLFILSIILLLPVYLWLYVEKVEASLSPGSIYHSQ